jgi:CheY-like chemotaxis protein
MATAVESKKRILWADDEIDLLKPHILFLQGKGFDVVPVPSGEDAIALVGEQAFDVVLLDEMMPGMGGLATLAELKDRRPSLPVILITKSEQEDLMDEALGKRITDYLIKPVNPSQIFLAVKKVFEAQELVRSQGARDYVQHAQRMAMLDTGRLDAAGWLELARDLANWDLEIDRLGDPGLRQAHLDQRRELNAEFGRFIERAYPEWGRAAEGERPMLSLDVVPRYVAPQLREGRRVVLVVIDCMRLDQWLAIAPLLEPYFETTTDLYYGLLPSATPYARNAIFAGMYIDELGKRYPDLWNEDVHDDRSKNRFERPLLERQLERLKAVPKRPLKYMKVYTAEESVNVRKQAHSFDSLGLVAIVFNFLDILTHGRSESDILQELAPDETSFRAVMRAWFTHSPLLEILRELSRQDATVFVTTDHGSVLGKRAALVHGSRETSTNLRYKFGTNLKVDPRQGITIKDPSTWRLPNEGVNKNYILAKEDYYFVYPTRFHEYERQFRGSFQHGGVSLEELIVPIATLEPRGRRA